MTQESSVEYSTVDIVVSTAFQPGLWLDYASVLTDPEVDLTDLARELTAATKLQWSPVESGAAGLKYSAATGSASYDSHEPLVVCHGADLSRELSELLAVGLAPDLWDVATWTDASVRLYDFNVGTVLTHASVRMAGCSEPAKRLAQVSDAISLAVAPLVTRVSHGVRVALAAPGSLGVLREAEALGEPEAPPEPLWCHTLIRVPPHESPVAVADRLLPASHGAAVPVGDGSFVCGLHASVALVSADLTPRVVQVMDRANAWWTATWGLDLVLLRLLHQFEVDARAATSGMLGRQASEVAFLFQHVALLRGRLKSLELNLGGVEWAIWSQLSEVLVLPMNLDALQDKQSALRNMHNALRTEVDSRQAGRLARIAAAFTVLTAIASVVAVWAFVFPGYADNEADVVPRLAVLVLSTLVGAGAVVWSLRAVRRDHPRGTEAFTTPGRS